VADLLPQLQQRLAWRETLAQVAWLAVGLGVAFGVSALLHGSHAR
jgi:zinc and cadmium transporter